MGFHCNNTLYVTRRNLWKEKNFGYVINLYKVRVNGTGNVFQVLQTFLENGFRGFTKMLIYISKLSFKEMVSCVKLKDWNTFLQKCTILEVVMLCVKRIKSFWRWTYIYIFLWELSNTSKYEKRKMRRNRKGAILYDWVNIKTLTKWQSKGI